MHRTKETYCPSCSSRITGYSHPEGNMKANPGDYSICVYCSEILKFTKDLDLEIADPEEVAECADLLQVQKSMKIARLLQEKLP